MNFSEDIFIKMIAAAAVIFAALIAAMAGFLGQLKIKQYENSIQIRRDKINQRLKFYLPLLRFSYELDRRIGHILITLHKDWLKHSYLQKIQKNEGFAVDPNEKGYFIISSIYMFACFFGWAEAIKRSGDSTKPFSDRDDKLSWGLWIKRGAFFIFGISDKQTVFHFDPDISTVSKIFQYEELFKEYISAKKLVNPIDACKIHKQIQYSIGELMLQRDGADNLRCKSFHEFYTSYVGDDKFRFWFIPLTNLLVDLCDFQENKDIEVQVELKNDIRPLRLLAIRYWCRVLMNNMAKELNINTPSPEDVLNGVSASLKNSITSVKIDELESYLFGIRLNNE